MPTLKHSLEDDWHTISYNGYPIASGRLEQFYNFGRTFGNLYNTYSNMAGYAYGNNFKRRKLTHRMRGSARRMRWRRPIKRLARKRGSSGRGVTFEHDRQGIYRKKKMPYRKKRRWRAFSRKVKAVAEKELGSRTVVFSTPDSDESTNDGQQLVWSCSLYGWEGDATHNDDLNYIGELENPNDPTAAEGNRVADNGKMFFKSAVLDITIRNTCEKITGLSPTTYGAADSDTTMEVDIYEITARKEFELGAAGFRGLVELYVNNSSLGIYDQNVASVGTQTLITSRGCTPFDQPKVTSQFGVKIWKKTKFFLKYGQTLTYQKRDPRRHSVYKNKILKTSSGANWPGMTKWVLVVAKVIPGIQKVTATPALGQVKEKISCGITRKYLYKVEGLQEDRTIYLNR